MPDRCTHANMVIATTMSEIESAFYDIESIKNDSPLANSPFREPL